MAARQTLDFECALVTGGGGGIGKAMAEQLIARGKKVIIIGRTESKLQSAAKELGHGTSYYVLDTGSIRDIKPFVERVVRERPDVDCLINNAGVQRELHIPDFDLEKADQEIDINIRGPMHLAVGFLEHFKGKKAATIMNVSSVLGFVPFSVINPVYNGTKAWAHMWSINLRQQLLQNEKLKHIKVVEIAPPTVATDLHRDRSDPDDNKKEKNKAALTTEEFMEFVSKGWDENKDLIGAGMSEGIVERWQDEFYQPVMESMKK